MGTKKRPSYPQTLNKAVSNALVIFMWAFVSGFHPEEKDFAILADEVRNVRESVMCGALTIPQLRKALREEYNVEVI